MFTPGSPAECVVLVNDDGAAIGSADKWSIHDRHTPLHLAFSCHVSDGEGRLLVTRRSLVKRTWPGVWTNAFCGHPAPGEDLTEAVSRRARTELGISVENVEIALPEFRYRAVDDHGVVENELCPVFVATTRDEPSPDPDEVMAHRWVKPDRLAAALALTPWAFSPWLVLQAAELPLLTDVRTEDVRTEDVRTEDVRTEPAAR